MQLSMGLDFIQWFIDDDFVYESYHYLKTLKQNYQTYLTEKINVVLKKMEKLSSLSSEEQKDFNFEVLNNMIIDLKARSPLLQHLDLYEV